MCYARLEPAELRVAVDSLSPQDVLVINWGVQFHTAAGKVLELLANYTEATVRAAADRPQRARPLIIWRETAPQHFPGGNGNGNFGTVKSWWATTNASCLPTEHPYRGYNELNLTLILTLTLTLALALTLTLTLTLTSGVRRSSPRRAKNKGSWSAGPTQLKASLASPLWKTRTWLGSRLGLGLGSRLGVGLGFRLG